MPVSFFMPLRIAVPFFVAIVFSILAIVHGLFTYSQLSEGVERESIRHLRTVMGVVQYGVNTGYRHGALERVDADLAQLLLDHYIIRAVVADNEGNILHDGQRLAGQRSILDNTSYSSETAATVIRQGISRVESCSGKSLLCGYFRVNLYPSVENILRGEYGLLYIEYDLAKRKQAELGNIFLFVTSLVASIIIAAALLWAFLHFVVTRRVDDLQYAAQVISNGDFSVRTRVEGRDELGRLASEINKMAGFIEQRQQELEENERRYRLIFNTAGDAMFVHSVESDHSPGCFIAVNDYACKQLGYSREELLAMSPKDLDTPDSASNMPAIMQQLERDGSAVFNAEHRSKDGNVVPVEISAHRFEYQGKYMVLSVARSLLSRKELEKELHHFKATLGMTNDRVLLFDDKGRQVIYMNRGAEKALGYSLSGAAGISVLDIAPKLDEAWFDDGLSALRSGEKEMLRFETEFVSSTGKLHPVDVALQYVSLPGESGRFVMIARDITEQKRIRHELSSSNRALRTISSCNMVLVKSTDEQQLLESICNAIVREGGYLLSWIGFAEEVKGEKRVVPQASAGVHIDYLRDIRVMWDDSELGDGPVGRAIRNGVAETVQDVEHDPSFSPWRDSAVRRGYQAVIALPLSDGEKVIGCLAIYAREVDAFTEEEIKLLSELAADVSYGIRTLRTSSENVYLQQRRKEAEEHLRENLVETIMAMASALEKRDPYTAGHQQRVALLATAIAHKMNLPDERVEGIRFGALIHDIGKIYIPAEILNRPGRLSEHEFGLIKSHSRVGYEIIKDVNFPWPVADMVHQHHERLDGSGYPDALKGDDILLEARILAVADVVEAITSHRPYRPGLGLEKAMAEIKENRGRWYDPEVVDACVALVDTGEWDWEQPG